MLQRLTRLFLVPLLAAMPLAASTVARADDAAPTPPQTQPPTPASDSSKNPPPPKAPQRTRLADAAPADSGATWVGPSYAVRGLVIWSYTPGHWQGR